MTQTGKKPKYVYEIEPRDGKPFKITLPKGRVPWALDELIRAGKRGVSPIDTPAPRWSGYKHKLKNKDLVPIDRKDEPHGGPYPGTHAPYRLDCKVPLLGVEGGTA